jgi:hypothetical protein
MLTFHVEADGYKQASSQRRRKRATKRIPRDPATSSLTKQSAIISMIKFCLLLSAMVGFSQGFVAPKTGSGIRTTFMSLSATKKPSSSSLLTLQSTSPRLADTPTGWDSFRDLGTNVNLPSGEEQRKYRRTVYTHKDWKKHRSQDRFVWYIIAIFKSGVYKNLGREVSATTLIATFIFLYNIVTGGYTDLAGIQHSALISADWLPKLGLPLAAFTLTSPSLGLLLGT